MGTSSSNKIHRREFVRQSATATLATSLFGSSVTQALAANGEYKLKSEGQFRSEAAQYTSAIREIRQVLQMKLEGEDLVKATAMIEKAAPALKFQLSSFVVMCLSNTAFVNAVKKKVPNQEALESFAAAGVKDLSVFLALDGVNALQAQMLKTSIEHRDVLQRVAGFMQKASGGEGSPAEAVKRAEEATECAQVWALVAALVLIVVAIIVLVIAVVGSPFSGGLSLVQIAFVTPLHQKYGPELSDIVIEKGQGVADARYARCVAAAQRLPQAERARAIARCQATWLNEKSYWLIAI
ncbi:MAG: hypothetical protein ABJA18_05665 [bacterium]